MAECTPAGGNAPVAVHAGHLFPGLLAHNMPKHIQQGSLCFLPWMVLHVQIGVSRAWLLQSVQDTSSQDCCLVTRQHTASNDAFACIQGVSAHPGSISMVHIVGAGLCIAYIKACQLPKGDRQSAVLEKDDAKDQ